MNETIVTASAPAKIILFGEHFVVYGKPAVVIAIDRRVHVLVEPREDKQIYICSEGLDASGYFLKKHFLVEKGDQEVQQKLEPIRIATQKLLDLSKKKSGINVKIKSSIPIAAGLGSSAAVVAATTAAVGKLLDINLSKEEICQIVHEAERFVHFNPSGIDPTISTFGGLLLFKNKKFTFIDISDDVFFVVGDTGIQRSTGDLVAKVGESRERWPVIYDNIMESGANISLRAVEALKEGNLFALGELMNINHALLSAVGVSNEFLEKLVHAARKAGALGAKLTGAGGGGCMIALVQPHTLKNVANAIYRAGGNAFIAKKTNEGVKVEK